MTDAKITLAMKATTVAEIASRFPNCDSTQINQTEIAKTTNPATNDNI